MQPRTSAPKLGWRDIVLMLAVIFALVAGVYAQVSEAAPPAPASMDELLRQASKRFEAGDYDGARQRYERATELDPGSLPAWRGLGWSLWRLGHEDRALAVWNDVLSVRPDDTDTQFALAQAWESRGDLARARDLYTRAIGQRKDRAAAFTGRARILQREERLAEAEADLRAALAASPADFDAQYLLALMCKADGRDDEAQALFRRLAKADARQPRYWRPMADILLELDRPEDALAFYRRNLRRHPDNRGTVLGMARAHTRLQQYGAAMKLMEGWLRRHPDDASLREELARAATASSDHAKAVTHLRLVAQQQPGEARVQMKLAHALRDAGSREEATAVANGVLARDESHVPALEFLLHDAMLAGDRQGAVDALERLAAVQPDLRRLTRLGNAWLHLAEQHHQRQQPRLARAAHQASVDAFERAADVDPQSADAVLGLAMALRLAGRPDDAARVAARVMDDYPTAERAWRELFEARMAAGDHADAEQLVQRWLQRHPLSVRLRQDLAHTQFKAGRHDEAIAGLRGLLEVPLANGVPVLLYHGLSESSPADDTMPVKNFRDQMRMLKREGYTPISVQQLLAFHRDGAKLPAKPVLITFDDARADSFRYADPVLKETGLRATMFVPAAEIGRHGDYHAAWSVIRNMHRNGRWDVQCHSYAAHAPIKVDGDGRPGLFLANRMWLADERRLETHAEFAARIEGDYRECGKALQREIKGLQLTGFAYPFGEYGQRSLSNEPAASALNTELVKRHFQIGFIQEPTFEVTRVSEPAALERFEVPWHFTGKDLLAHLRGINPRISTQLLLADFLSWDGRYADARKVLDDVSRSGRYDESALLTRRGRVILWQGDFEDARRHLATAVELKAESPEARASMAALETSLRPRLSLDGTGYSDNADRSNLGVGPTQRAYLEDRMAFAAGYRHRRFADERFDTAQLDPASTAGTVALRATGHEVEGEVAYRWDWRTALTASVGAAKFEDASSEPMFGNEQEFTLGSLGLELPLWSFGDVALRANRGYVSAAGAVLEGLGAAGAQARAELRPFTDTTLETAYGLLRYDDGNERTTAQATLLQRIVRQPEVKVGYRYRYDDTLERNPFFYTPDRFSGHDGVVKASARWLGWLTLGAEGSVGTGREGEGESSLQTSLTGQLRIEPAESFALYLSGGQTEAADYRSVLVSGGMSLTF